MEPQQPARNRYSTQRAWEWAAQQSGEEPGKEEGSRPRKEIHGGPQQIKTSSTGGGSNKRQFKLRYGKAPKGALGGHKKNNKGGIK